MSIGKWTRKLPEYILLAVTTGVIVILALYEKPIGQNAEAD